MDRIVVWEGCRLVQFRVLGPLGVEAAGVEVRITGRRERTMLAVLLVHGSRPIPLDRFVDALWEDHPPVTVRRQVRNCLWSLRRQMAGVDGGAAPIVATGSGIRLHLRPEQLDASVFGDRVARARRLAAEGSLGDAVAELRVGLALWRGPALTGFSGPVLESAAMALNEQRLAATELCLDLELRLGRHQEILAELAEMAAAYPLRESFAGRFMMALHRSGRTAEAVEAYGRLRARMAEELGLEPGPPVQEAYAEILRGVPPSEKRAGPDPPAHLPAAVAGFVGRDAYLDGLNALLESDSPDAAVAVPIVVISGAAGVGKTALVAHWGHRVRGRFPDGQLYLDLKGFATEPPMRPLDGLAQFLRALGCPPDRVPVDVREAADGYRSHLAGRRVLVVLDNAADAEQVRPLLPGSPGCMVLVTSRSGLAGLVARDGARRVHLDVLTTAEAVELLERQLGGERVAAERAAVAELVEVCAGLPLALRIVAANLADRPWEPIATHVAALRKGGGLGKLAVGRDGSVGVRGVFDLSFRRLTGTGRRMFRLFGLAVGADVSAAAAAALAGTDPGHVVEPLDELVDAHLVRQHATGRYAVHDLLRLYAAELAEAADERAAATERLVWWYERNADAAARRLYPLRLRLPSDPGGPVPAEPAEFADAAAATAWLHAEHANLVRVVTYTAEHGPKAVAWRLADTLRGYFWLCLNAVDWLTVARAGVAAAEAEGSAQARAAAWFNLGDVLRRMGRNRQAPEHYERVLALAEELDWTAMTAAALGCLGGLYRSAGRPTVAEGYLIRALALARRIGDARSEAVVLGGLGAGYRETGRVEESIAAFAAAMRLFRDSGSHEGELGTLAGLGTAWHAKGDLAAAADYLARAVAGLRDIGDRSGESDALPALAAVECDRGRLAVGEKLTREAVSLATELDDRRAEAAARVVRAAIHHRAGRHDKAIAEYHLVLDLAGDIAEPYLEVEADVGLAEVHAVLASTGLASVHARRAVNRCRACGYRLLELRAEKVLTDGGGPPDEGRHP